MKRFFTIGMLTAFGMFCSHAQITITQANMPSLNDTIRYSNSNTLTLDFSVSDSNYHWDYSTLKSVNQDVYKFQALTSTPYASLAFTGMPIGAIGYKIADSVGQGQTAIKNIYTFFEKKNTGWSAVGTGFTPAMLPFPAGGVYKDKDEIYTFPLKYLDQDSTTFEVKTPLGNQFLQLGYYKQKGYRLNVVEGYGSISTPYAANIACLKIKSVIVEIDSVIVPSQNISFGFPNTRIEYKWLSLTEKIPMLEVTGGVVAGKFTAQQVRFRDYYRAKSELTQLTKQADLSIYPNPCNNRITLQGLDYQNGMYLIFNSKGQIIANGMIDTNNSITTENLSSGLYFLTITAANQSIQSIPFSKQ
jgi:hypothetical protein